MDNNPIPESNKELEDAANALNEAAVETPAAEAPINEETSAEMDKLLNEEEAPKTEKAAPVEAPVEPVAPAPAPAAPEAPVAPAAPVDATTTASVDEAAKSAEPTPAAAPAPKKKVNKKALAIGLSAGAVLLAGGGFAFAYAMNNSEENIALSAFSELFSNHAKTISGYFELTPVEGESDAQTLKETNCIDDLSGGTNCGGGSFRAEDKNPVSRIRLELTNNTNSSNESQTSATFIVTYNEKDIQITVDSVIVKDYTLYVSISNLKEAVKQVMSELTSDPSMSSYGSYAELYESLIDKVVGEVDGIWWKISVPDLVDSTDSISSSDKEKIKEAYSCVVDVANKAAQDSSKYADIYKANAFASISKYKGSAKPSASGDLYSVNLDAGKFANFVNAMSDQVDSYGLSDCMKKLDGVSGVNTSYEKKTVEAKEFEEGFKTLNENLVLVINNGFFSHKLSGIYFAKEDKTYSGVIDFKIEDLKGTVSAPTDTKDISELVKNVTKAYEEWEETSTCLYYKKNYPSLYNVYCDAATNKVKTSTSYNSYSI